MRIAIATDAWMPQVNGVVRTLSTTVSILLERGYEIELITPQQFLTVPMPGYREIRLALAPRFGARRALKEFAPDIVHLVTEGPIGWSARSWCLANNVPFTSAFHTRFPDYASVRTGISAERFWPLMRRFHGRSKAILAATPGLIDELAQRGMPQARLWSRGIDAELFGTHNAPLPELADLPRPIMLSVGRVSAEKNLDAFLSLDRAGTKVVVGDGPAFDAMQERFPDTVFLGSRFGTDLARAYASADVFVFPSRTDTFGLVMIEALASGVPVAGYRVPGPLDIVGSAGRGPDNALRLPVGAIDDDLGRAIDRALTCDRSAAAAYGRSFDWDLCTDQFVAALEMALTGQGARAHAINQS